MKAWHPAGMVSVLAAGVVALVSCAETVTPGGGANGGSGSGGVGGGGILTTSNGNGNTTAGNGATTTAGFGATTTAGNGATTTAGFGATTSAGFGSATTSAGFGATTSVGATTAASSTGGTTMAYVCPGFAPTTATITDFTVLRGTGTMTQFGAAPPGFGGGFYQYGNAAFTVSSAGLVVTSVSTATSYDGVGTYFGGGTNNGCIDGSKYSGITFTLKDTGGSPALKTFDVTVKTNSTTPTFDMPAGKCNPGTATSDATVYMFCHGRTVTMPVNTTGVYTVKWTDLPASSQAPTTTLAFDPTEIVGLQWQLSGATAQSVKVTISNIAFAP